MSKLFGTVLVLLIVLIGSEIYFLAIAPAPKTVTSFSPTLVPSPTKIGPTVFPTASPEILAEIDRWQTRQPTKISHHQTKKYGQIFVVQATLVKKEANKIDARAENGQKLTFVTDTNSQFFSRRGKEGKDFTQTLETTPFPLREGHVYLFEWQVDKNNNSSSIINLWRISSFLD